MAKSKTNSSEVVHYQHDDKRTNIPTSALAGQGTIPAVAKKKYYYNPHLSPVLRFDATGQADKIQELIAKAGREPLTETEQKLLSEALKNHQPWLEWTGKREAEEKGYFAVDPVALHIHERVSTQAILRAAKREDIQKDLFADPQEDWRELVKWYQHDVDWTNRLILGDSLQVMTSLATRENLSGQVQMIYMDPPYGIKYSSNFQPEFGKVKIADNDKDLTREPEMVKAYRDTWELGIHSYSHYMLQRLHIAKVLLKSSGSIFVQISDENLHTVRQILDEVFGKENFVSQITFVKTSSSTSNELSTVCDYLLWYAKERPKVVFNQIYLKKEVGGAGGSAYTKVELESGMRRGLYKDEKDNLELVPKKAKIYGLGDVTSQNPGSRYDVPFEGKIFRPEPGYWKTEQARIHVLLNSHRLDSTDRKLGYVRYFEDFPYFPISNVWTDTLGQNQFGGKKVYVVQTALSVIERCILMTSNPGDLILDPTCGSGSSPVVGEKLGRRWIGIDSSRIAIALAKNRILTERFSLYKTKDVIGNTLTPKPSSGFVYNTAKHIMLSSIAQNFNLDPIFAKHELLLDATLARCNQELKTASTDLKKQLETKLLRKKKEEGKSALTEADERRWQLKDQWEHWEVPFDTDPLWPQGLQSTVTAYRQAWRAKMDEVNKCIADNADQEELVDDPVVLPGVRVSGPFTVEGVMPLENYDIPDDPGMEVHEEPIDASRNAEAYLTEMLRLLKNDGVTFPGNKVKKFKKLEPVWTNNQDLPYHAEGWWEDSDDNAPAPVAIAFGPQYGPLNVRELEEMLPRVVRSGMSELVLAAFNFDPETINIIEDTGSHPKLTIHKAFIRPDVNPGMAGLLKDTPRSQLFTVFGKPEIELRLSKDGDLEVELLGVDIYDPLTGSLLPTSADKVAAWFLDSDYDGRCFCITQAFFPDQDAWEKIAKALKTQADQYAFSAYKGTISIPFKPGQHKRIAVKVIDPRGNEVMVVKKLEGK